MEARRYPSDLTDAQWALVEPLLPVYPGGRPRTTSLREVLNAIFYIVRTGCQWRFLPKDFPPKSTVWGYFDQWRHNGTLEAIHRCPAGTGPPPRGAPQHAQCGGHRQPVGGGH